MAKKGDKRKIIGLVSERGPRAHLLHYQEHYEHAGEAVAQEHSSKLRQAITFTEALGPNLGTEAPKR